MQAKILRVIQDCVVTPLGGRPARVDVRLVAATHRDLPALVAEGGFRADLYYRLNVVPIDLPPLRERLADIVPLAEHFLARTGKRLSGGAASRLLAYDWPGNVRELRNVVERAALLVRGAVIAAGDIDLPADSPDRPAADGASQDWLSGALPGAVARLDDDLALGTKPFGGKFQWFDSPRWGGHTGGAFPRCGLRHGGLREQLHFEAADGARCRVRHLRRHDERVRDEPGGS